MTWDIVKIAALVLTITQAVKGLAFWTFIPEKVRGQVVSVLVTALVVGVVAAMTGHLTWSEIIGAIMGVLSANGVFKLVNAAK